ncbi:hypothetical protein KKB43_04405 [Patescibacteria group bacterium]|nr:hypothetical protein [Patescibacteria group bacterium]MBU4141305.1 hypothetical protein [Patescibacteria group bacterium]MBU4338789.1 hypothetical protein [Patescibacteria group bacterium]MBU4580231.1 hypothetical protein [Patescibacteria group bacterium]
MKITICGSLVFSDKMSEAKEQLEKEKHEVRLPLLEVEDEKGNIISAKKYHTIRKTANAGETWVWDRKEEAMRIHFDNVVWADAILILNYHKNNIPNYIGANTLIEMGLAFYHKKKIFLLNPVPNISYKEEVLAMKPIIINNNFELINQMV